ncbi:hypothetical protein LINPERHAP1_LOCUS42058 [Linum perenne]
MSDRKRKGRGSSIDHGLKPHKVEEPGFNESDKKMKKKKADDKSCLIVDDDLVVIQILSRLPVKSLMRFKSVCKSWKLIIEQDLNFMNLHYTHSEARPVDAVYGNCGSVYWFASHCDAPDFYRDEEDEEYSEYLMAFDIGSEQFRIIPIPRFTLAEDKGYDRDRLYMSELIEMDGCPTVARHYVQPNMVRMWRFHDGTTSDWTQVGEYYAKYGGQCVRNVKAARLYFHDLKNSTFRQFKVEGISWLPDDCYTECTPLVESLFPLLRKNL